MAGSVFSKIAERVYAKNLRFDIRSAIDSTTNVIPTVKAGEMNEALYVLDALDVPVQKQFEAKKGQDRLFNADVLNLTNHIYYINSMIYHYRCWENSRTNKFDLNIPQLTSIELETLEGIMLERKGLRVRLNGVGKVRSQSIPGGSRLVRGQTISLTLH